MSGAAARLATPLVASLTLGLAPFVPEPHVVGKIRWVAGGAVGMGAMDWFDLALHGAPWVWLLAALLYEGGRAIAQRRRSASPSAATGSADSTSARQAT